MRTEQSRSVDAKGVIKTFGQMIGIGMPRYMVCLLGAIPISIGSYSFNLLIGLLLSTSLEHFEAGNSSAVQSIGYITIAMFIGAITLIIGNCINLRGSMGICSRIQRNLISRWIRQTEGFAAKQHTSEAMTVITSDMKSLEDFYFQGFMTVFLSPLLAGIIACITIIAIDWRLLLPPVFMGLISLVVSFKFSGAVQRENRELRSTKDQNTRSFSEAVNGNVTNRMLGAVEAALDRYQAESDHQAEKAIRAQRIEAKIKFITRLLDALSIILFLGIGTYLATYGELSFSLVLLAYAVHGPVNEMMNCFGNSWNFIVSATASGERVISALHWPQERDADSATAVEPDFRELTMENVYFSYEAGNPVINGLSLSVKRGQTVALVGESGSGKTTIFQLLLRFYEPDQGSISINHTALDRFTLESWRGHFVYLQQDAPLLAKTVGENIAMGVYGSGVTPTEEEIVRAAKAAGAHDFIMDLPGGYASRIDECAKNLSGGQRQRIAIARAFLSRAPIVLLDEPTAALDPESKLLVQKSLGALMREKTVFIVAHQLETIQTADMIFVLESGRIIEQGGHETLIKAGGAYAKLYHTQENIQISGA